MHPINLYDYTRPQLAQLLAAWGGRPPHVARLWSYLYREDVHDLDAMPELPPRLRARLAIEGMAAPLTVAQETRSDDGLTRKFLLDLADGQRIETVLMRYQSRLTACLSSQAGCAFGCVFCATGQMGFSRDLTAGEIVAQALHVDRLGRSLWQGTAKRMPAPGAARMPGQGLRNVVLMGMGEPLHNYDSVMTALDILRDRAGLALGAKHITLSTVGLVPGIVRLADESRPYSLAVSLHAATQPERAAILPAARAWPLDALMEACRYYTAKLDRKIFFEWTLIEGQNDSAEQARALASLLRGIPAQVNLIPLNRTAGFHGQPGSLERTEHFKSILQEHGLPTTVRQRRGIDIAAGCGQLATADV